MARRSADDDDAPWLAEAAPAPRTDVSRRSVFWTVLVVLGLAAIVAIGFILLISKKDGGSAQGYMNAEQAPVITAEPGPYKIKPSDPAGMPIEGLDGTMYDAGAGLDSGSAIDPSLAPEAPLPRPGSGEPHDLVPETVDDLAPPPAPIITAPPAPTLNPAVQKPLPAKPVAKPPTAVPAAPPVKAAPATATAKPDAPAGRGSTVQLGAFSSEEKASAAWAGLAGKHGLSGKRIIAVESGGKTLYRLRASAPDASATCARIKAAGDACAVVE
jgi:cell division septation protein DedD